MSSEQVIQHQPLCEGEIRLVNFGAGHGAPVLANVRLDSNPVYVAVSYCWRSENCLHPFRINNQILILTSSLHEVFSELWRQNYRGQLWADAICIKQDDDKEKAVQIPLMHRIYGNAIETFAWLGPGYPSRDVPIEVVRKLAFGKHERSSFEDAIERLRLPGRDSQVWQGMVDMLSSSWFDRIWTLQEAIIPMSLALGYGSCRYVWSTIVSLQVALYTVAFDVFWRGVTGGHDAHDALRRIHDIDYCRREYRNKGITLMTMLQYGRGKKASRAQDHVYAMYGFMPDAYRDLVPLDMSASPQQLFTQFTKVIFMSEPDHRMRVLANVETSERLAGLPSWVPDLTSRAPEWMLAGFCGFNAGPATTKLLRPWTEKEMLLHRLGFPLPLEELRMLHLGFVFDIVVAVQPTFNIVRNTSGAILAAEAGTTFLACVESCRRLLEQSHPNPLSEKAAWLCLERALVCDRPRWEFDRTQSSGEQASNHLRNVVTYVEQTAMGLSCDLGNSETYVDSLASFNVGRSFFMTKRGFAGLGPGGLRDGDHILLMRGGETPFAARQKMDTSDYELIGECFVDGIMEGQAYRGFQESGRKLERFGFE